MCCASCEIDGSCPPGDGLGQTLLTWSCYAALCPPPPPTTTTKTEEEEETAILLRKQCERRRLDVRCGLLGFNSCSLSSSSRKYRIHGAGWTVVCQIALRDESLHPPDRELAGSLPIQLTLSLMCDLFAACIMDYHADLACIFVLFLKAGRG